MSLMSGSRDALIESLSRAPGGDRDLDADVGRAIGWATREGMCGEEWKSPHGTLAGLPHFTTSIDAAFAALPEGWHRRLGPSGPRVAGRFQFEVWPPDSRAGFLDGGVATTGQTEALAICAAAVMLGEMKR